MQKPVRSMPELQECNTQGTWLKSQQSRNVEVKAPQQFAHVAPLVEGRYLIIWAR